MRHLLILAAGCALANLVCAEEFFLQEKNTGSIKGPFSTKPDSEIRLECVPHRVIALPPETKRIFETLHSTLVTNIVWSNAPIERAVYDLNEAQMEADPSDFVPIRIDLIEYHLSFDSSCFSSSTNYPPHIYMSFKEASLYDVLQLLCMVTELNMYVIDNEEVMLSQTNPDTQPNMSLEGTPVPSAPSD